MARIPYHLTGAVWEDGYKGNLGYLTDEQMRSLNCDGTTHRADWQDDGTSTISVVWDRPYDLTSLVVVLGSSAAGFGGRPWTVYTSVDTTDGQDGTWVSQATGVLDDSYMGVGREIPLSVSGARGVRYHQVSDTNAHYYLYGLHVHGTPVAGSGTLAFWHPTSDEILPDGWLDQSTYQGGVFTKDFRIKNESVTQTATGIVVSAESWGDTTDTTNGFRNTEVELALDGVYTPATREIAWPGSDGLTGVCNFLRGVVSAGVFDIFDSSDPYDSTNAQILVNGVTGGNGQYLNVDDVADNWMEMNFSSRFTVAPTRVSWYSNSAPGPINYTVQGSDALGAAWTDLITVTDGSGGSGWSGVDIPQPVGAFQRIRIKNNVVSLWQMTELEVYGVLTDTQNAAHSATIASLAPGAISDVVTMRITRESTTPTYQLAVRADVGGWS